MSTNNTIGFNTGYALRERNPSTLSNIQPFVKPGRKVLDIKESPSLVGDGNHNCHVVDPTSTRLKVYTRLACSLLRFMTAYAWECTTTRGKTYLNGSSCHCGKCQSCHAALSPTLYDNKLQLVLEKVQKVGLENLPPLDLEYLNSRFTFSDEGESLTRQEWMGSFINTPREKMTNATFDNPTASNKVDSRLEDRLRKVEDDLAAKCTNNKLAPKGAMSELHLEYRKNLEEIEQNLLADITNLTDLFDSFDKLIASQKILSETSQDQWGNLFENHLILIKKYIDARDKRFKQEYAVPRFDHIKTYLNMHQSPFVLKELFKKDDKIAYFINNAQHLKIPIIAQNYFQEALTEVNNRLIETRTQLEILSKPFDEINEVLKLTYGERTPGKSKYVTPSKEHMSSQLNQNFNETAKKRLKLN